MSLIRVGSTSKYADGWDAVFGGGKATPRKQGRPTSRKAAAAKPAKKAAKKVARKAKATTKAVTKARKPGKSRRG